MAPPGHPAHLTAERLAEEGFEKMTPVPAGGSVEIVFFISYESTAGKIDKIRCGIFETPAVEQ